MLDYYAKANSNYNLRETDFFTRKNITDFVRPEEKRLRKVKLF